MWKFEQEFRLDKPETVGETDKHFDLDNYKDWLEEQLSECRKQTAAEKVLEWMKKYYEVNGTPNYGEIIAQLEMAIEEEKQGQ